MLVIAKLVPTLLVSIIMDVCGAACLSDCAVNDLGGSHFGLCFVSARCVVSWLDKAAFSMVGHGWLPCTRRSKRETVGSKGLKARAPGYQNARSRVSNGALQILKARAQTYFWCNRWPGPACRGHGLENTCVYVFALHMHSHDFLLRFMLQNTNIIHMAQAIQNV